MPKRQLLLVLLAAVLSGTASGADQDVSRCAKIENTDERLSCYDELARVTETSAGPAEASPTPSHLTETWKLGPKQASTRRLTDIMAYRPNYVITRWSSNPNVQPSSPAPDRQAAEPQDLDDNEIKFQVSLKTELISRQAFENSGVTP